MELLTKQGWTPINDIESVIVSIRSLMVVGDGRVQAAVDMGEKANLCTWARQCEGHSGMPRSSKPVGRPAELRLDQTAAPERNMCDHRPL